MLRRHPKLEADRGGAVMGLAKELGYRFDLSTAGAIHNSLLAAYASDPTAARVLEYLITKPMKPALVRACACRAGGAHNRRQHAFMNAPCRGKPLCSCR